MMVTNIQGIWWCIWSKRSCDGRTILQTAGKLHSGCITLCDQLTVLLKCEVAWTMTLSSAHQVTSSNMKCFFGPMFSFRQTVAKQTDTRICLREVTANTFDYISAKSASYVNPESDYILHHAPLGLHKRH